MWVVESTCPGREVDGVVQAPYICMCYVHANNPNGPALGFPGFGIFIASLSTKTCPISLRVETQFSPGRYLGEMSELGQAPFSYWEAACFPGA